MDQLDIELQYDIGNRMIVFPNGDRAWYKNKQVHRDDGPAEIGWDGSEAWYQYGKLHRDGGPAVIQPDGATAWYQHDLLHRLDGPAIIRPGYAGVWYINDKRYTDNKSYQQAAGLTDEELLLIILKFGNVQ